MASSRPGGAKSGAWGGGNAAQSARRQTMETMMAKKSRRTPKSAAAAVINGKAAAPSRRQPPRTKKQIALSLLERPKGASIPEMQRALGWQAHSVRGFLAGTVRKMPGVTLVSDKIKNGPRRYRVEAVAE